MQRGTSDLSYISCVEQRDYSTDASVHHGHLTDYMLHNTFPDGLLTCQHSSGELSHKVKNGLAHKSDQMMVWETTKDADVVVRRHTRHVCPAVLDVHVVVVVGIATCELEVWTAGRQPCACAPGQQNKSTQHRVTLDIVLP